VEVEERRQKACSSQQADRSIRPRDHGPDAARRAGQRRRWSFPGNIAPRLPGQATAIDPSVVGDDISSAARRRVHVEADACGYQRLDVGGR
jgi:hypothetical protein